MINFIIGFFSSLTATGSVAVFVRFVWPAAQYRFFSKGIRIEGPWAIIETRNGVEVHVGQIDLKQNGYRVSGKSTRRKKRDGTDSNRSFVYQGKIQNNQITLLFEDQKGDGFDSGSYVFSVQNDGHTMIGMATFHGKPENRIVSEPRILKKLPS
ncbi:hypothetical protein M2447_001977 [Ereboglobus sp. PH5-10]|uniref:hypothetical protein n=1 Tax=Ereboglobus sp. PH5-10 TaxID=2940629 RepID=UPI002404A3FE|nr:hypothetical protein [Ereboglobus sp. PH5-10]MDF9827872.1 hypothetical protein [Ereboglobus sp. PH5-10]